MIFPHTHIYIFSLSNNTFSNNSQGSQQELKKLENMNLTHLEIGLLCPLSLLLVEIPRYIRVEV